MAGPSRTAKRGRTECLNARLEEEQKQDDNEDDDDRASTNVHVILPGISPNVPRRHRLGRRAPAKTMPSAALSHRLAISPRRVGNVTKSSAYEPRFLNGSHQ